tara:strand:- start:197 stop:1210 length:1014 start_codon:yes stop_codon:yes gene_type:complete
MSDMLADENLIYYNIDIRNDTQERIIPSFDVNRVQSIVNNPLDYEMAIVRFSSPLTSIPLFVFKNDIFKLSLKIGANQYTEPLVWISNNNVYDDKNVYDIQHLLDMINNAWALAFTNLKAGNTITSTTPPFMTHSNLTNLITLFVPQTYLADNIDVYTNSNMHRRLHSFYDFYNEFVYEGDLNYRFIVQDLFDNNTLFNGVNYYYFTQLFSSIGSLTDLKSIQVFTNSIPVNRELIGGQINKTDSFLTDFEPIESNNFNSNGYFQFFPQGPLHYIDLLSTENIKRIDLQIKWTTKDRQTETYYLQPNEEVSMKLLFKKKQNVLLNNYITEQINEKLK